MTPVQVKTRSIPFNQDMVSALRSGRKTQTRRIMKNVGIGSISRKPKPVPDYIGRFVNSVNSNLWAPFGSGEARSDGAQNTVNTMRSGWFPCPYGQPGDRLYVREDYYQQGHWEEVPGVKTKGGRQKWMFVADSPEILFEAPAVYRKGRHHKDSATTAWHKRLGRFMPRTASRLLLEITEVRCERLQDISESDAVAEGVESCIADLARFGARARGMKLYRDYEREENSLTADQATGYSEAVFSYQTLWDKINGAHSWAANHWVWVVSFKIITPA